VRQFGPSAGNDWQVLYDYQTIDKNIPVMLGGFPDWILAIVGRSTGYYKAVAAVGQHLNDLRAKNEPQVNGYVTARAELYQKESSLDASEIARINVNTGTLVFCAECPDVLLGVAQMCLFSLGGAWELSSHGILDASLHSHQPGRTGARAS
jgi:hypothetical protein